MLSLPLSPAAEIALVNKRELANILGVSLPTIGAWIDRYPALPIVERGTNGKEWRFDPAAVRAFMVEREAEEEAAEAARAATLAQLALPITDPGDAFAQGITLDDIKTIKATDDLRRQRGFLTSVPETRQALTSAIARWNRAQRAVIAQAARDFALPDAVRRALEERFEDAQRQFVQALRTDAGLSEEPASERLIA